MIKATLRVCVVLALVGLLSACAVSQSEVNKAYKDDEATVNQNIDNGIESMALVEDVESAFLGDRMAQVAYEATLPPVFHQKLVTFPANITISTISQLVSSASGYAVHLSPDVFMSRDLLIPRDESNRGAAPQNSGTQASGVQRGLAVTSNRDEPIYKQPCQSCQIGAYLHGVTEDLGLAYNFDGTTINISRFVTKTFIIAAVPGKVTIKSDVTKGTDTTTGSQSTAAGGAQANTGSFSALTKASRDGSYDFMASIKDELNDLKSPPGKVEIDAATRLVMVRDTKENVERMTELLERENAIATRQVAIRIRTIQLALTANTQAGISADVIFNKLQNGLAKYAVSFLAPTSLATATGGTVGLSVLQANAPLSGTNAALQALNAYGKTVSDDSQTKVTLNGVPVPVASYETKGYLASTTPSSGSITGTSGGVPGLTPGSVTVGTFINVLPSVNDNNRIILTYWNDSSQLNGPFTTISTGTGATLQTIQLPDVTGNRDEQNVSLADGQTIVLYGEIDNNYTSGSNVGIGGASAALTKSRTFQIVMLTATVVPSM